MIVIIINRIITATNQLFTGLIWRILPVAYSNLISGIG